MLSRELFFYPKRPFFDRRGQEPNAWKRYPRKVLCRDKLFSHPSSANLSFSAKWKRKIVSWSTICLASFLRSIHQIADSPMFTVFLQFLNWRSKRFLGPTFQTGAWASTHQSFCLLFSFIFMSLFSFPSSLSFAVSSALDFLAFLELQSILPSNPLFLQQADAKH